MPIPGPVSRACAPTADRLRALTRIIGNTPLLGVDVRLGGLHGRIYAKCEHLNLTGSIKDRMALHILRRAYATGAVEPGDAIVEASSGNTGISFAAIGRALGHPVTIFMPDWMSRERADLIRSVGADVVPVSEADGGFAGAIARAEEYGAPQGRAVLPRQFSNEANVEAHETTTGPEIVAQLAEHTRRADAFVAGVGTGGTVMGVGKCLRSHNPAVKVYPLEPLESPTLSVGFKNGHHRVQGISDEFVPPIVHLAELDDVVAVSDGDAILMAQKLARDLGLAVGISSGANFLGALRVLEALGHDATVVTVFPDDNKKYLTTDLLRDEPVRPSYITPFVELTGFDASHRVCNACYDRPI